MFYADDSVRVTATAIHIGDRSYRISELSYVWHRRGRADLRTTSRLLIRVGLVVALLTPVLIFLVVRSRILIAEQDLMGRLLLGAALIGGSLLAVLLLAPLAEFPLMMLERSYDRGVSVKEIWVRSRGADLMVLRTTDAARFGRIYRAIERAIERDDDRLTSL